MRWRRPDARVIAPTLTISALLVAASFWATPVRADSIAYLKNLHDLGINTPGGDSELKEWGWEVCALSAMGMAPDKVKIQAVYNSQEVPPYGMSVGQADTIVHYAQADLCNDRR
jgi:hypothetical protein